MAHEGGEGNRSCPSSHRRASPELVLGCHRTRPSDCRAVDLTRTATTRGEGKASIWANSRKGLEIEE
jgi:hypothetical protein